MPWAKEPTWLAALARSVPVGIVVIDAAGTIVWSNDELRRLFRYADDQLVGTSIEQLLPERLRGLHVTMRADYTRRPSVRAMGSGRELYGRRADGSEFPLEIGLRPLEAEGRTLFVATVVDITARRAAETTFHRVIEAAPCGMLVVDPQQRILFVNEQLLETFGYSRAELVGEPLERLLPERHRGNHGALFAGFMSSPAERAMGPGRDLTGRHRDGTEFAVEIGLRPVELKVGPCVLATVIDVTERKRTEQHLRRANADLEEFAYAASHDLRSPVRGINDLADWIAEDLGDSAPESVRRNLGRLRERARRVDTLVSNLLAYALSGVGGTEPQSIVVAEWLREQLDLALAGHDVKIVEDIQVPRMIVPATPLGTVVRNLVANAVVHNDAQPPEIEIAVRPKGAHWEFTVTDNGPGIPEEVRERIFKLFQRLRRDRAGSGVGLALVKRLVESHGGSITVGNRPDGKRGSVFTVLWPQVMRRQDHGH